MKTRLLTILTAVAVVILAACTPVTEPYPGTYLSDGETIIPTTTKVVSEEVADEAIISMDDDGTIELDGEVELVDHLELGDVLVGQAALQAPDGFLRKITAIREEGGHTFLETRQAALDEAIQACSVRDSIKILPSMVDSVWVADGVTYNSAKDLSTSFDLDLDLYYDVDGNNATEFDRVTISGDATFTAAIDLIVDIQDWELQEFEFALERRMELDAEVIVGAGYEAVSQERTIASFYTSHYIIMVGFVPITFQPRVDVVLKFDVSGSVELIFGYALEETTRNGARFINGEWENIDEKARVITPLDFQEVTAEVSAKLSVGTKNSVKVYGLAGPYIKGMGYLEALVSGEASQGGIDLGGSLAAGADVELGFSMEFLSHSFFDFSTGWEIYRQVIWEGDWHFGYAGTILVQPQPAGIAATWVLEGPEDTVEGAGPYADDSATVGTYSFRWEEVSGWVTPEPVQVDFILANEDTVALVGVYVEDGPGTIMGEIRDAVTNERIFGAEVRYQGFDGTVHGETLADGEGSYAFPNVQAGTYQVIAEADGYETNTAANLQVIDIEGEVERADFALPPLSANQRFASFSGRVFNEFGSPLNGANISLSGGDQTNGVFRSATSLPDGTYSITGIVLDDVNGVPIEEFTVIASAAGYNNFSQGVDLVQNETITNVDFLLQEWDGQAVVFSSDCESTEGWELSGFWNRHSLQGMRNQAWPTYVNAAPDDYSEGFLPSPAEGQYAFWYGQPSTGNFMGVQSSNDNPGSGGTGVTSNEGQAVSPAFYLPATQEGYTLTYDTWFEIESVNPNASGYDIMTVTIHDISTGETVELGRLNPIVDPTLPERYAIPFTSGGFNSAPVWRQASADLSVFAGHTVRLEFRFQTMDNLYNGFRGWLIDNIQVVPGGQEDKASGDLSHNAGGATQLRQ